jgi:nitroreductase
MSKLANTDYPIHELIAGRWSPYAFSDRPVEAADLLSCLEAARWAPSSYNEQPWSYIVATRDDTENFQRVLSCLVEANQAWAQSAPVLILCCTKLNFSRNGKPNAAAIHDLGLAAGNLSMEATARGLYVHQMIGIIPDRAEVLFAIPTDVRVLTAMAIGYVAEPGSAPENLRERDLQPRSRKPLDQFVFTGNWGETASILKGK